MHATHNLLQCPLHNLATMTIDTITRTITYASADMIQLLGDEDPTGTQWPSKQDQQLCFTTLVDLQSTRRQKRLLTCEHMNTKDPSTTIIQCADISALEHFYYNNSNSFFNTFLMNTPPPPTTTTTTTTASSNREGSTIILRMNPYGVIQAAFAPIQSSSLQPSMMIGQPLMRFIHNDDIPMLCSGLRQVTRCQQDTDDDDVDDDDHDHDDAEFTMISFDLRCDLRSILGNSNNTNNNKNASNTTTTTTKGPSSMDDDDNAAEHTPFYHFTTVVTSTQDVLCIMRPSSSTTSTSTTFDGIPSSSSSSSLSPFSSRPSSLSSASAASTSSFITLPSSHSSPPSPPLTKSTSTGLSLYQLAHLLRHSGLKVRQLIHGLQQALWHAAEQGLMLLAHYLAVVMVLALQYYRLARHPSFWLETSELALRCLVAETKTRPELDRLFGWLEWSGLPSSRRLFGMALDHGSEWFISMSLRP